MDIALYRGEQNFTVGFAHPVFFFFDERDQIGHCLFHHTGRFHDLRQEHLTGAKQVTNDVHAIHQGAFDDVKGALGLLAGFFGIFFGELGNAVDQGMGQPLINRFFAPFKIGLFFWPARTFVFVRDFQQTVGRIRTTVQDDVFDTFTQFFGDLFIDHKLTGINDAHIHACLGGIIQENRMHGFADRVVAAERERYVRHTAGNLGIGQARLDQLTGFDEINGIVVVFFDAGCDRKDVGIENDIFWREAYLIDQHPVAAFANLDLAINRVGLTFFIKRHDNHSRPITAQHFCLCDKGFIAFFQADRVDDPLALKTFKPGLNDIPFRTVDHDRHTRDVWLGSDQIDEFDHRRFSIKHGIIHVDIDDLCTVFDLLTGDFKGCIIVFVDNQLLELNRARNVGTFADIDES